MNVEIFESGARNRVDGGRHNALSCHVDAEPIADFAAMTFAIKMHELDAAGEFAVVENVISIVCAIFKFFSLHLLKISHSFGAGIIVETCPTEPREEMVARFDGCFVFFPSNVRIGGTEFDMAIYANAFLHDISAFLFIILVYNYLMEKVIEVEGLTKSYGKFKAVDDLSLYVEKGRIFGLLGPNGSGKSTTINCILSLLKYQAGEIKIFGETMSPDNYELKSKIGVVFQDVAVFNELSVYDNIDYFCGLYIRDKKTRKKYVEDAIKLTALQDFKKFRPKQLSGGLLRRLNIACGIAHKPKLIFLDEPTVAVDPQSRNAILEGIVKLNKAGATIVYTSHYMEEVEQICDRIVILDKGQIIAKGTKESLKELTTMGERITVEIANLDKKYLEELKEMPDVLDAKYADGKLTLTFARGKEKLPAMIDYLKKNELSYERIFSELPSLNDVFLELTGKELRD